MNALAPHGFTVPTDMAVAAMSQAGLVTLKFWIDHGARPKASARVAQVGRRLLAVIDFEVPMPAGGRYIDGVSLPLIVVLYEGQPAPEILARVEAGDRLLDHMRATMADLAVRP